MRYAELRPDQLADALTAKPLAIWPVGALEWHGPHLPLGLDGLVAEAFAERLQAEHGGVLLPTHWLPMTTLPHPASIDVPPDVFLATVRRAASGLSRAGASVLALVTGHYAQGHSIELFRLAGSCPEIRLLAASPLEPLEDDSLLDHAARWETAQLLAVHPDLVRLDLLPAKLDSKKDAVLGEDPRQGADPQAALRHWNRALSVWGSWIAEALAGRSEEYEAFRNRRLQVYEPYAERFETGGWEAGLREWWKERTSPEP
jgi:creatinine amidohydrolase